MPTLFQDSPPKTQDQKPVDPRYIEVPLISRFSREKLRNALQEAIQEEDSEISNQVEEGSAVIIRLKGQKDSAPHFVKFNLNTSQEVTSVSVSYRDYGKLPNQLPSDFFKKLFAGTPLDYGAIEKGKDPLQEILLKSPPPPPTPLPDGTGGTKNHYPSALLVQAREIAFSNDLCDYPILAAQANAAEVIVAAHSPSTKKLGLCVIDTMTEYDMNDPGIHSLKNMFKFIRAGDNGATDNQLNIHLTGHAHADPGSAFRRVLASIKSSTDEPDANIHIQSVDIWSGTAILSKSLVVDARTGKVYRQFDAKKIYMPTGEKELTERLRADHMMYTVYGDNFFQGREADFDLALRKAGLDSDALRDVTQLLRKPGDATQGTDKNSLEEALGKLSPPMTPEAHDVIRKKFWNR